MELNKLTVQEFMDLLASDAPAPGGGSAAGISGALGASLASMVSALTLGRKKYADSQALAQSAIERAGQLQDGFLAAMERDTKAYNGFCQALSLPKDTEEEKEAGKAIEFLIGTFYESAIATAMGVDTVMVTEGPRRC